MRAFAIGLSGAVLLALAAGCRPQLAQVELGDKETQWNSIVRESYSGFRPPRTAPPAIKDKNTPLRDVVPATELPAVPATGSDEEFTTEITELTPDEPQEINLGGTVAPVAAPQGAAVAEPDVPAPEIKYTEYVVKPGDSLSVIAKKVYKDGRLYERIYEANKDVIKNPNRLPLGMKLRIPQL